MTSQRKVPAEARAWSPDLDRSLSTSVNHIPVIRSLSLFPPDMGGGVGEATSSEPRSFQHIFSVHVVQARVEELKANDYEFIFHIS